MTLFSIIFSSLALCLSIATFILTRWFQRSDRRKSLTIDLWQRWDGEKLRNQRVIVWNYLTGHEHGPIPQPQSIQQSVLPLEVLRALNDVEHFLDGLGKLREARQLDEDLFNSLFVDNMNNWRSISDSIVRSDDRHVKSKQKVDDIYRRLCEQQRVSQTRIKGKVA
jgi:hypothetical protein